MEKGSIRSHRVWIMCATMVVVSLGWTPSQAFALDVPIDPTPVTTTVAPVVTTVTNTVSNTAPSPVDTVTNTVSNTVPNPVDTVTNTVSNTAPNPVDTVTNTVSNTVPSPVDTVSNTISNTAPSPVDTVSNTLSGSISNTVGDVASAAGSASSAETTQVSSIDGVTSLSGTSSTRATSATGSGLLRPMSQDELVMLAQRNQAPSSIGDEGHATCVAGVGTACQSLEGTGGSWTRSVADIIRKLLALTGMSAFALFVLACCLTLAGAFALYRSRDRSELGSA